MDTETITEKYTGLRLDSAALSAAAGRGGVHAELANALWHAASDLAHTESDLAQVGSWVTAAATRLATAIAAPPGATTPSVNPLGELQSNGPRFDQLIAVRSERINHLQQLVRLWTALSTPDRGNAQP